MAAIKSKKAASKPVEVEVEVEAKKSQVKDIEVEVKKVETETAPKVAVEEEEKPVEPVRKVQKNRMRCFSCRKKVGLTGTECRCGYVFCGEHRYPEEHKCDFDFQKLAQQKVATKTGGAVVSKVQGEEL